MNQLKNIEITKIYHEDLNTLFELSNSTFRDTFAAQNTPENLNKYLSDNFNKEKLEKELSNPNSFFYFAKRGGEIVAYLKINIGDAQTESFEMRSIEIERIYVRKPFLGMKIGQTLLEFSKEIAHQQQANVIWLGVWEENYPAIAFYQKNGFQVFDRHVFVLGNDHQIDILMKLNLD
ncbi:MAG: GNAT family N-acetyltransferase [Crocinitomicaceae bacterium]|nr:GNAT family N-acetyltransferase [Crocinitomicaceae bacterium]